jgi:excisionase family DNA binding protein
MSNAVEQPKAFSVSEVARLIGRSELATRRAIERGQIPARKWGHRVVVLAEELDEFLRQLPIRNVEDTPA